MVVVLTALGERDRAVQDGEVRAGEALRTMTNVEALSVREAVDLCGRGVIVREKPGCGRSTAACRTAVKKDASGERCLARLV